MSEIAEYAKLIAMGLPTFIEIKVSPNVCLVLLTIRVIAQGVTFCGKVSSSNMTMKNVPFHEEVFITFFPSHS